MSGGIGGIGDYAIGDFGIGDSITILVNGAGDIRLVWNPATGTADINLIGPSLELGNDLQTAVLISLWTDQTADPGDILPVNTNTDPRGWWADAYEAPDQIGSRLWQIFNRIRNQQTLNDAQDFATKSLQWMIDDGVASAVSVTPSFFGSAGLALAIQITEATGAVSQFSYVWGS
jgi:phage gp46-like protein